MPSFSIKDVDGIERWLKGGYMKAAKRGILSAAQRTVSHIVTELIPGEEFPPVFNGPFRAGWRAEPTERGADIVNTIPYSGVIDKGARAENIKIGRRMIDAITEWVTRKGFVGKLSRSDSKRAEQIVSARNIAWAIAINMKKVGIFNRNGRKGLAFSDRAKKFAVKIAPEEIGREISRYFGK